MDNIMILTIFRMAVGTGIAFLIWRFIMPRGPANTPRQYGYKWFLWWAMFSIWFVIPKFMRTLDHKDLFALFTIIIIIGPIVFLIGYAVGKIRKLGVSS